MKEYQIADITVQAEQKPDSTWEVHLPDGEVLTMKDEIFKTVAQESQ